MDGSRVKELAGLAESVKGMVSTPQVRVKLAVVALTGSLKVTVMVVCGSTSRVPSGGVTPTTEGDYMGKCFELCGTYHSRMLFNVKVVSQADYDAYLADLADQGWVADEPLLGGSDATTQAGLDEDDDQEGSQE